ncbi:MAG TPA: hypothetical protein VEO19_14985 [Terriglobia bacterium]|nr:hypothetical protein [Terriglobia bacterium]
MTTQLWQDLLALHPARYVIYLLLIGVGLLKRKAIAAAARTATNAVTTWFWNAVRKRVLAESHSSNKTYSGTFYGTGRTRIILMSVSSDCLTGVWQPRFQL